MFFKNFNKKLILNQIYKQTNNNTNKTTNKLFFSSSQKCNEDIGFIGLGNMGNWMAKNLVKNGHNVSVFDLNQEAVKDLENNGAKGFSTIKETVKDSNVIITMLPSSPHVQSVYYGSDNKEETSIFKNSKENALFIDCSTISPSVSRELTKESENQGFRMLDAPVSGGVTGSEQATLTFMIGGNEKDLEQSREIFNCMGKNIVYCGSSGNGQVTKLCNNLALGIEMVGVSEAMNLGVKLGMDPKTLANVFNTSSARCWSSDTYNPVPGIIEGIPSSNNYNGGFGCKLMAKDISLAVNAAYESGQSLPLGGSVLQIYNLLSTKGYANKDFSAIYDFLSKEEDNK